jgi:hypothetical protein
MLGKEVGFSDSIFEQYVRDCEIHTIGPLHPNVWHMVYNSYYQYEVPSLSSLVFHSKSNSYQLVSEGSVEMLLDICTDVWTGKELKKFNSKDEEDENEEVKNPQKKIYDYYQNALSNDHQVIGYAYKPLNEVEIERVKRSPDQVRHLYVFDNIVEESDQNPPLMHYISNRKHHQRLSTTSISQENLIMNQVFLALLTTTHPIKEDVCEFIEDLGSAGIRFVYFSMYTERPTKAFAERLGLETDWNCCILLSGPDDEHGCQYGYVEPSDIKARLPRGIENIRYHLQNVDDIPLHVSIFAECRSETIKEMIKIYHDYGEVVCCFGSTLNVQNGPIFSTCDLAIAIEPLVIRKQLISDTFLMKTDKETVLNYFGLSSALNSLTATLIMPYETSPYIVTEVIREARGIMLNGVQGLALLISCQLSLTFCSLFSLCFMVPPMFNGYQVLWLILVIAPMISVSFLFSPYDADIMKQMPGKRGRICLF